MADTKNKLYYGDNLAVLRGTDAVGRPNIPSESVDLIYLDPPFNSRQDYNVLFAEKDGNRSAAQITAFKDTWEWDTESRLAFEEVIEDGGRLAETMRAFHTLLSSGSRGRGTNMLAYLAMMAPRLLELRRVLKPTGSIYLHCDPTASHYLKLLMDGVFGSAGYRNEITWRRTTAHNDPNQYGRNTDILFFYTKSDDWRWNPVRVSYEASYAARFKHQEKDGRLFNDENLTQAGQGPSRVFGDRGSIDPPHGRHWLFDQEGIDELVRKDKIYWTSSDKPRLKVYLEDQEGAPVQALWADINPINSQAQERLGYPTQKPEALLERILKASSNEGDVVLDPFCGCGTTVQVAQKLNRRWIGIDITHLAIGLIKTRLDDTFGHEVRKTYEVIGEPTDVAGAEQLANDNKYQFQYWALGQCGARPTEGMKKGADRGIDGRLYFHDDNSGKSKQVIFSVKGGRNVGVAEVRDLIGVLDREKAEIGVYISFAEPTGPMKREAAEAGFYTSSDGSRYPRVQLLTIRDLIEGGKKVERPMHVRDVTFKQAPRARGQKASNLQLDLGSGGA